MEFELTEEQHQMKMSVREFAEAEITPHVMEWDEAQHFPIELQPKLGELGLLGVLFPEAEWRLAHQRLEEFHHPCDSRRHVRGFRLQRSLQAEPWDYWFHIRERNEGLLAVKEREQTWTARIRDSQCSVRRLLRCG